MIFSSNLPYSISTHSWSIEARRPPHSWIVSSVKKPVLAKPGVTDMMARQCFYRAHKINRTVSFFLSVWSTYSADSEKNYWKNIVFIKPVWAAVTFENIGSPLEEHRNEKVRFEYLGESRSPDFFVIIVELTMTAAMRTRV